MPRVLVASLTIAASGELDAAIARDPVCIRGCNFGAGYCRFDSYAQCQTEASGRDPCSHSSRILSGFREPPVLKLFIRTRLTQAIRTAQRVCSRTVSGCRSLETY